MYLYDSLISVFLLSVSSLEAGTQFGICHLGGV